MSSTNTASSHAGKTGPHLRLVRNLLLAIIITNPGQAGIVLAQQSPDADLDVIAPEELEPAAEPQATNNISTNTATRPLPIEEVRLFAEALEAIRTAYVSDIDDRTLIDYAIRGMLAGLDPHSAYLSADD